MTNMSPKDRVFTAIEYKEPDRIPLSLGLTLRGAKLLDLSIKDYFQKPEHIVKAQMVLNEKFGNDTYSNFFTTALEYKAWGGEVIYFEDGPPNTGKPIIKTPDDIQNLHPPEIKESETLQNVIRATELLKDEIDNEYPILGVVISPFSLPIIQMGFNKYIELIYNNRDLFDQLIIFNEDYVVKWANAQINAGADAIAYYDPFSSPEIVPRELYLKTGFKIAKDTIAKIDGPVASHFASARTKKIIKDVMKTGSIAIGISSKEDIEEMKKLCEGKLAIMGNLNTIGMVNWSVKETEEKVKQIIKKAGKGGGIIVSDNHGEIPFQVPDKVLLAIKNAIEKWGNYPLDG